MKGIQIVLIIVLLLSIQLHSQNNLELDSLEIELELVKSKILSLQKKKAKLENEINLLQNQITDKSLSEGIKTTASPLGAILRDRPNFHSSKKIYTIPYKDTLSVLSKIDGRWLKINYRNSIGFITKNSIEETDELLILFDEQKASRYFNLRKRFGEENARRILNKTYWIGMSKEMARESLGNPSKINRSTGSWGVHEQWVYNKSNTDSYYLYFENGILKSFQN